MTRRTRLRPAAAAGLAALLSATLAAAPAGAGCSGPAPDPVAAFHEVNARAGSYLMAVGQFSGGTLLDEVFALATDGSETSTRLVIGHFTGKRAGADGFSIPIDSDVEIAQRCHGENCQPRLDETRYLVFLQRSHGRLRLSEDGCTAHAYADPSSSVLEALVGCLAGKCN